MHIKLHKSSRFALQQWQWGGDQAHCASSATCQAQGQFLAAVALDLFFPRMHNYQGCPHHHHHVKVINCPNAREIKIWQQNCLYYNEFKWLLPTLAKKGLCTGGRTLQYQATCITNCLWNSPQVGTSILLRHWSFQMVYPSRGFLTGGWAPSCLGGGSFRAWGCRPHMASRQRHTPTMLGTLESIFIHKSYRGVWGIPQEHSRNSQGSSMPLWWADKREVSKLVRCQSGVRGP